VVKGYSQVEGLNFDETFALVARLESIHILHVYATHHDFKVYQMDVKSARNSQVVWLSSDKFVLPSSSWRLIVNSRTRFK
jgi:hypothetical protein